MTFNSRESSRYEGRPYELYLWACGGTTWAQTPGDATVEWQGRSYEPHVISRTEITQDGEAKAGAIQIRCLHDNPIVELLRTGSPLGPITLTVYTGHFNDSDVVVSFRGKVASIEVQDIVEVTVVPAQDSLKMQLPGINYQAQCPRIWGLGGCPVIRWDHRVIGTISSVSGIVVKSTAFATKPNNHFKGGWIETPKGLGKILGHTGDAVTLVQAIPELVSGMDVAAFPTCLGTEADCNTRFNALKYYLGFSRIPKRNPFGSGGL